LHRQVYEKEKALEAVESSSWLPARQQQLATWLNKLDQGTVQEWGVSTSMSREDAIKIFEEKKMATCKDSNSHLSNLHLKPDPLSFTLLPLAFAPCH
jgi:hypothetical protein